MPEQKINLIYIAGYGFSGSTLLERMIACHPKIIGLGEVYNLLQDFDQNEICSCGLSLPLCPYWKEAYSIYLKDKKLVNSQNIFSLLSESQVPKVQYFCDSSKTTFGNMLRPFFLSKKYEVTMIHITRDGAACLQSVLKRSSKSSHLLKSLIVGIHWSLANLMASSFQFFNSSAYLKIKYEDLIEQPNKLRSQIYDFLKINNQNHLRQFNQNNSIPLTHQLSGNAIRKIENLILKNKDEFQRKKHVFPELIFKIISFPIYKLMGY